MDMDIIARARALHADRVRREMEYFTRTGRSAEREWDAEIDPYLVGVVAPPANTTIGYLKPDHSKQIDFEALDRRRAELGMPPAPPRFGGSA